MKEYEVMVLDRDTGSAKFGKEFKDLDEAKKYYVDSVKEYGKRRVRFYEVERKFVYEV